MTLLGWTFDQWAITFAKYGTKSSPSIRQALELKAKWNKDYHYPPAESLIGVSIEKNMEMAADLFSKWFSEAST